VRFRSFSHAYVLAVAVLLASCGQPDPDTTVITSHEDLCAGVAPEYASGVAVATGAGCPFVQQVSNISTYGDTLPAGSVLSDGHGGTIANVTHACDVWTLGTDAQGVAIIVHRDKGSVIAHGNLHPGQELTKVHSPVVLPVTVH
jgi:hypothetical protein